MPRKLQDVFRRKRRPQSVIEGAKYCCRHSDRMVETAEVLSMHMDAFGIPHVRYRVRFERPDRDSEVEGPRMLSLGAFFDHYSEPERA